MASDVAMAPASCGFVVRESVTSLGSRGTKVA
jgi:hypothetical protein